MLDGEFRGSAYEILRMAQRKDFIRGLFIKMEEKKTIKEIKIEPLPFFKKGTLVYSESGHELKLSDKHYRCKELCKSDTGEKQIKKENLEKSFGYLAQKLRIDQETGGRIGMKLLKDCFCRFFFEDESLDGKQDILDSTIRAMDLDSKNIKSIRAEDEYKKTGFAKGIGKVKKEDIQDFEKYFVEFHKELQPLHLFSVLLSYLKTLSDPRYATKLGQGIALICRKIFISNAGKVEKIELERWGWYILNYINRTVPNYLKDISEKGIIIVNDPNDEILKMDIEDAIKYFEKEKFQEAMHWFDAEILFNMFTACQTMLRSVVKGGPEDVNRATMLFLSLLNSNPMAQFAMEMLPAIGKVKLKPKKGSQLTK